MRRGLGFHARRSPGVFNPASLFLGGTVNGAWYDPSDSTTLFSDRAGTTPCGTPGGGSVVPVGLMLDKSQNGVGTNGAKRVNLLTYSEQFDNAAWTKQASSVSANAAVAPDGTTTADKLIDNVSNTSHYVNAAVGLALNGTYTFSVYAKAAERNFAYLDMDSSGTGGNFLGAGYFDLVNGTASARSGATVAISAVGNGWYRCSITATGNATATPWVAVSNQTYAGFPDYAGDGTSGIFIWGADLRLTSEASTLPLYQRITDTWYSTMAGNHAIAANDTTARPELSARVNLLRWSEVFDATASGSAWVNAGVTVTDGVLAPNGTNTADTITGTTGTYPSVRQAITLPAAGTYKASCYFQKTSGATRFPSIELNFAPGNAWVVLNTNTGVAANAQGTPTNISVSDAGGYWLVSFDVAVNITSATFYIYPASSSNGTSFAPNLTGSCVAWGADLRPANIGTTIPAYQRISDANTYDAVGFPRYLAFNGTSSAMSTPGNVNLSGTDKVTVFAGVRKNSDAALGTITELGTSFLGSFTVFASYNPAANYSFADASSPSVYRTGSTPNTFTAPITNVLAGSWDLSQSTLADQIKGRVNGAAQTLGFIGVGTPSGTFMSGALYVGSRNNASLFFNGNIYSLIVVGSAVSAGNISSTEQWVAGKTGITL